MNGQVLFARVNVDEVKVSATSINATLSLVVFVFLFVCLFFLSYKAFPNSKFMLFTH